ncbi:MAG TPA: diacylglycerol kinase family protein, partial [Chloroflexota bacterium]|nr:diacylglycerol kinase family protein [Chloroflexota bacterium]
MEGEVLVVVNPVAGQGRARRAWPAIAERLQERGIAHRAVYTRARGEATRLTAEALRAGARTVVAAGGDGTANEVINGFFHEEESAVVPRCPEARFAFLPLGTGSDLARAVGTPRATPEALLGALSAEPRRIDLGRVTYTTADGSTVRRYFVNGADLGLGGELVARLGRGRIKRLGGFLAYFLAAIQAILNHQAIPARYTVDDAEPLDAPVDIIFVANGRFIGGGMLVAPMASLDDGYLDALIVRATSKPTLLVRLLPAIYRGSHLAHPAVQHERVRQLTVSTTGTALLQLDGEQPGRAPA